MEEEPIIPNKSPNDLRSYEAIILPNQLKVLLVHDQTVQKSACSISVGVGSFEDGNRSLGLAHFLEHMLFMGSRKYPSHNQYSEFISLNSGLDNAYTSDEETNYYFEIANNAFKGAVERIADFFVGAALTETCITKERQAVHEQYKLRTCEDNSRKWEILKHFAVGPYHNFSIGNNQTLDHPDIRSDLVQFYNQHYSSNRINAVLLSNMTISEMKSTLLPFLEEIVNKQCPPFKYEKHFPSQNLQKIVKMQSIKEETLMEFFWVIEDIRPYYKQHPEKYITHVLGHEGTNSLLSILKLKDYASEITSYSHELPSQTIIGLEIHLTETGQQQYKDVYNIVIDYAAWMKAQEYIYNEIKETSQISFRFKEKIDNDSYVCDLSSEMHKKPLQEILNHRAIFEPFNSELLNHILKQLNPFNLIVVYSNQKPLKKPLNQKYLGGKFTIQKLPDRKNSKIVFEQLLKNEFLPLNTELMIKPERYDKPKKLNNIYFLQEFDFNVCRGGIELIIHSKQSGTFIQFYGQYLQMLLKQWTYNAECLKLESSIQSEDYLSIKLFGFNDTVCRLMKRIGEVIASSHRGEHSETLFNISLDQLIEDYENFYCQDVDQILSDLLDNLLRSKNLSIEQTLAELKQYQYSQIANRIDQFWKNSTLEWIFVGNFEEQASIAMTEQFEANLQSNKSASAARIECLKLGEGSMTNMTALPSEEISTSGCIVYYEVGEYSEELYYKLSLIRNYIKEPFFDTLRTQKQLAYYLTAYIKNTRGILSLCFILISSNKDPYDISNEIKTFVHDFFQKMENDLTNEKYEQLKSSLRTKISSPHNSLNDYFEFIVKEIEDQSYYFNRKEKEEIEKYLNSITKESLLAVVRESLKKCLDVWVVAKPHEGVFQQHLFQGDLSYKQIKSVATYFQDKIRPYQ